MKNQLKNEIKSFGHAFNGLSYLRFEKHFKFHLIAAVFVIGLGFYQNISLHEWALIILYIGFVLVAEAINTAIEKTVDYISLAQDTRAKMIKDIGAGMVLIAAMISSIVGIIIFFF